MRARNWPWQRRQWIPITCLGCCTLEESATLPLNNRLIGSQNSTEFFGEEKKSLPPTCIKPLYSGYPLYSILQECKNFHKPRSHSKLQGQKLDMKQVACLEPTNIRHHHKKFSHHGDLAPRFSETLA
jgi:hypothetical protein